MFIVQLIDIDVECSKLTLEDFAVLREFQDVFPKDILGLPPKRDIGFTIDLEP